MRYFVICLAFLFAITTFAQETIPYTTKSVQINSGIHSGVVSGARASSVAFEQIVSSQGAPWVQLQFGECNLGTESYITITSLKDGGTQKLNAKSLKQWDSHTAYFNGDKVLVKLHVNSFDQGVSINIKEVISGQKGTIESICGSSDDRIPSKDPAAGRIVPVGCTGWIINGGHVTAGHCASGNRMSVLQFNVPLSNADGSINNPPPEDQYPIIRSSVKFTNGGIGRDWCAFQCGPNSNTNLLPIQAQNAFFRVSDNVKNAPEIRITGFGVDDMPRGSTGRRNQFSQTQQTHFGRFHSGNGTSLGYIVDTTGGNSGSPVINNKASVKLAIGVHTHGGCRPSGGNNHGTSFLNKDFKKAVENLLGENVVFVDQLHPNAQAGNGTILAPFATINQALQSASSQSIVYVTPGTYKENLQIHKPITFKVTAGPVTLGAVANKTQQIVLTGEVAQNQVYQQDTIVVSKDFVVQTGANITLKAKTVVFLADLHIPQGASLQVELQQNSVSTLGKIHTVRGEGTTPAQAERIAHNRANRKTGGKPYKVNSKDLKIVGSKWECILVVEEL